MEKWKYHSIKIFNNQQTDINQYLDQVVLIKLHFILEKCQIYIKLINLKINCDILNKMNKFL